jgi:hypothetical protein
MPRFRCIVLMLPLICACCSGRNSTPVGGSWAIDDATSLAEPGQTRGSLVVVHGRKREVVDRYVWAAKDYGDDCVAYRRTDEVLFVCGEHQPLLLAKGGNVDSWTLEQSGPQKTVSREVKSGAPSDLGIRFPVGELKIWAQRTPLRQVSSGSKDLAAAVDVRDRFPVQSFTSDESPNVNRRNAVGSTALIKAAVDRNADLASALINAGADVNGRGVRNLTALMAAASRGSARIVDLLIRNGADVNATNDDRMTALMMAARAGQPDVVRALLEAHADFTVRDVTGMTALQWALDVRNEQSARLLREAGAKE